MKQTVIPEIPVPLPGIVWFEPNPPPPPHTSPKNTLKALWKFQFRFKLPNNDPAFYLSPPPRLEISLSPLQLVMCMDIFWIHKTHKESESVSRNKYTRTVKKPQINQEVNNMNKKKSFFQKPPLITL